MGFKTLVALALFGCGILRIGSARAEGTESEGKDRAAILEFAATVEREISERTSHAGPAIGVEFEPIEDWLEIEFGASTNWSRGATNWELELPFKKPFRLSETVEVMPGLGPTRSHTTQAGQRPSAWGAEAVVDLFFWRSKHFGWYLEPSYGIALGNHNAKSVALTGGIFFTVP